MQDSVNIDSEQIKEFSVGRGVEAASEDECAKSWQSQPGSNLGNVVNIGGL